jgi:hypothetical protein
MKRLCFPGVAAIVTAYSTSAFAHAEKAQLAREAGTRIE